MGLPAVKKQQRFDSGPDLFLWSGKKEVGIYTPRMSFMLPGETEGGLALFFEEAELQYQGNFYVPLFETFLDSGELLDRVKDLQHIYSVQKIYARRTKADADFIAFRNRDASRYLRILDPPNAAKDGDFLYHLSLLRDLLRPGRERIFFPENSDIPRLLQAVPEMAGSVKDTEHRALAALVYGVAGLVHNETLARSETNPKPPYDPLTYGLK